MKVNSPPLLPAAKCPRCKAQKLGPHPQRAAHAFCAGCGFWSSEFEDVYAVKDVAAHREAAKLGGVLVARASDV